MGLLSRYGSNDFSMEVGQKLVEPCKIDYERLIKEAKTTKHLINLNLEHLMSHRNILEWDGTLTFVEVIGRLILAMDDAAKQIDELISRQEKENIHGVG